MVIGFGFTAHRFEAAQIMQQVDDELDRRITRLMTLLPPPNDRSAPDRPRGPGLPPPPPPGQQGNRNQVEGIEDRLPPRALREEPRATLFELFGPFDEGGQRPPPPRNGNPPERGPGPPDGRPGEPPGGGPGGAEAVPNNGARLKDALPAAYYFSIWHYDGNVQARSVNIPEGLAMPEHGPNAPAQGIHTEGDRREAYRRSGSNRYFLVGRSIVPELDQIRRSAWYLTAAGGAVLALGLLGGWWVSTRAIRPIQRISNTAEKIASGDLSQRISSEGFANELQRLAGVLNSTFARLDAAFTQQAHFTADAAHELRTPVTVMLTHTQNGLLSADLTEEQRESFEACQRAAQRMRRLIESLLMLARLDAGQESLKHEPFDLAHAAQECAGLVQPLAAPRGIIIHLELHPAEVRGDADRIGQVITNLLTNAIEYNHDSGEVIAASAPGKRLRHSRGSSDSGPGIAPADLPRIFERFYRGDTARTSTRRNGLGLAISKAIVESHGGTLTVESPPGRGATFIMRLPSRTA